MTDYHTTYKAQEGETTEWDDIQAKHGNKPAKVKRLSTLLFLIDILFSTLSFPLPACLTHIFSHDLSTHRSLFGSQMRISQKKTNPKKMNHT